MWSHDIIILKASVRKCQTFPYKGTNDLAVINQTVPWLCPLVLQQNISNITRV